MSEYTQAALYEAVKEYLDGELDGCKWNYQEDLAKNVIFGGAINKLPGKISELAFCLIVAEKSVCCYHIAPINVPEPQRSAVAEYLHRANFGLPDGNFEMDYDEGEMRFKITLQAHDLLYDDKAALQSLDYIMRLGPAICGRYGDNLVSVALGNCPADTGIKELVEQSEKAG